MKLFVWTEFCTDYTPGLAFAIAENEEEARELVRLDYGSDPYDWGDLQTFPLDQKISFNVSGGG